MEKNCPETPETGKKLETKKNEKIRQIEGKNKEMGEF